MISVSDKKEFASTMFDVYYIEVNGYTYEMMLVHTVKYKGKKYAIFFLTENNESTEKGAMIISEIVFRIFNKFWFEHNVPDDIVREVAKIAEKYLKDTYWDIE